MELIDSRSRFHGGDIATNMIQNHNCQIGFPPKSRPDTKASDTIFSYLNRSFSCLRLAQAVGHSLARIGVEDPLA